MIRVAVSGAVGRMGSLVCQTIDGADGLELGAAIDPAGVGSDVCGVEVAGDPATVEGCDVVVDFTNPAVVLDNLRTWNALDIDVVVGTSGFDASRIAELEAMWTSRRRCLVVPNFSVGAVLMMRMAELAAPFYERAEIIELHHDQKVDAPSGTSMATAARMASSRNSLAAPVGEESLPGARGAHVEGIPIHSVRLAGLVAHQEVIFGGDGETLTIRHDSLDRSSFMPGVVAAIRGVGSLPDVVTLGLDGVLGL